VIQFYIFSDSVTGTEVVG